MQTTVKIDRLRADAKALATRSGQTLSPLVDDTVRSALSRRDGPVPESRLELPTFHGGQLQPRVDLDDSAALLDLIERAHS
jgi:hypothetical protein